LSAADSSLAIQGVLLEPDPELDFAPEPCDARYQPPITTSVARPIKTIGFGELACACATPAGFPGANGPSESAASARDVKRSRAVKATENVNCTGNAPNLLKSRIALPAYSRLTANFGNLYGCQRAIDFELQNMVANDVAGDDQVTAPAESFVSLLVVTARHRLGKYPSNFPCLFGFSIRPLQGVYLWRA
jgi:hypothetical protein